MRAMFSPSEIEQFQRDGYFIVRGLAAPSTCAAMVEFTQAALAAQSAPLEYEADVKYPGAPAGLDVPGGRTVRRLLHAYERDAVFRQWAESPLVVERIRQLLGAHVVLPQAHHNCIMTKQPRYSSATLWHQDIRYWSFQRPELISVWTALVPEFLENGCLQLLPGTHTLNFAPEQLDEAQFLRVELAANQALLANKITAELSVGDVLFFHSRTFHGAERNQTDQAKFSLVFTYRPADNLPVAGSRSAQVPEIVLS